jgi:ribonuclease HII
MRERDRLAERAASIPIRKTERPTTIWERRAWAAGREIVAGVDEVGRGAWAGPLVAAALVLPRDPQARARITRAFHRADAPTRDSKLLTPLQRARALDVITRLDVPHAVVEITPQEIDELGLGPANRIALCRAVAGLEPAPEHVLVDAYRLDDLDCPHEAIVRGDNRCVSIALASIVAKLHRDAVMQRLDCECPEYGFAAHKGYGTAAHARAIAAHGISPHHRRSFAPIGRWLDGAGSG